MRALSAALLLGCAHASLSTPNGEVSVGVFGDGHAVACLPRGTGEAEQVQDEDRRAAAVRAASGCASVSGGRLSLRAQAIWAALMGALAGLL